MIPMKSGDACKIEGIRCLTNVRTYSFLALLTQGKPMISLAKYKFEVILDS